MELVYLKECSTGNLFHESRCRVCLDQIQFATPLLYDSRDIRLVQLQGRNYQSILSTQQRYHKSHVGYEDPCRYRLVDLELGFGDSGKICTMHGNF
jgi:hypothetical protein